MGHQSYVIPYETNEQLEIVLEIITKHNAGLFHDEFVRYNAGETFVQLESGEELSQLMTVAFKSGQSYKNPRYGPTQPNVLLAGNDGGRSHTFAFLDWHLRRAFPDLEIGGFHAMQSYPWDSAIKNKLKKSTEREIPYSRVEARINAYDEEITVRPARMTTRVVGNNPAFKAAIEEHAPGLFGKARMKRLRECGVTESPYKTTYETVEDGFVVYNTRFASNERDQADAAAKALRDKRRGFADATGDEYAERLAAYKQVRAEGRALYQVIIKATDEYRAMAGAREGEFWLTDTEAEHVKKATWASPPSPDKTYLSIEIDGKREMRSVEDVDAMIASGVDPRLLETHFDVWSSTA